MLNILLFNRRYVTPLDTWDAIWFKDILKWNHFIRFNSAGFRFDSIWYGARQKITFVNLNIWILCATAVTVLSSLALTCLSLIFFFGKRNSTLDSCPLSRPTDCLQIWRQVMLFRRCPYGQIVFNLFSRGCHHFCLRLFLFE